MPTAPARRCLHWRATRWRSGTTTTTSATWARGSACSWLRASTRKPSRASKPCACCATTHRPNHPHCCPTRSMRAPACCRPMKGFPMRRRGSRCSPRASARWTTRPRCAPSSRSEAVFRAGEPTGMAHWSRPGVAPTCRSTRPSPWSAPGWYMTPTPRSCRCSTQRCRKTMRAATPSSAMYWCARPTAPVFPRSSSVRPRRQRCRRCCPSPSTPTTTGPGPMPRPWPPMAMPVWWRTRAARDAAPMPSSRSSTMAPMRRPRSTGSPPSPGATAAWACMAAATTASPSGPRSSTGPRH